MANKWLMDASQARPVGELAGFVLDPNNLRVRYIKVAVPGESPAYVREDHIQWNKTILVIQTAAYLGQPEDFVRDQKLLTQACNPIGYRVIDQQKRVLGRVQDFSFSGSDGKIERLMIHPVWWQSFWHADRIISRNLVSTVNVAKRTITITESNASVSGQAVKPIPA